jgi:hypothetical protein
MTKIPVDGLHHVSVVVGDARATAEKYARVHGITEWHVRRYDAQRSSDATTHGFRAEHQYLTATGSTGSATFVLVQPLGGWTTYHEFLNTRGDGIHSICPAVVTPGALAELSAWLATKNVGIAQSARRGGAVDQTLFDTREKLGGFYIEILGAAGGEADEPVDETWTFAAPDQPVMPLAAIMHFGVVVRDLSQAMRNYSELFGQTDFTFRNWHPGPGSLQEPFYLGQPVNHAYFTTMVTPHEQCAFEVIQPTLGPSHYKEDFLLPLGPGIHHIHGGMLEDVAAYQGLRDRMAAAGAPLVMGGGILDNFIDFYYFDTRAALAGYVIEVVVPGANFAKGRPNVPFAMTANLSQPVDAGRPLSAAAR